MIRKGLKSNTKSSSANNFNLQNFDRKAKLLQNKSEQLVKENQEMEQRIASLKLMMQKEREERERLGGYRWKSSKEPTDAKSTMPKGEKANSKAKGQPKFKILSDKPLEKYNKKTKVKDELGDELSICGRCEKVRAKLECMECGESYCPPCFKQFHAKGAMRKHTWKTIDQERSSASKGRSQAEFLSRSSSETSTSKVETSASEQSVSSTNDTQQGGSLLIGTYDEEASAKSFQDALREWRNESTTKPAQKKDLWVNPVNEPVPKETRSCATEPDVASITTEVKLPPDLKINFNPTMSYADRLLLKKHRKDPSSKIGHTKSDYQTNKVKSANKKMKSSDVQQTPAALKAKENRTNAPSGKSATQESRSKENIMNAISQECVAQETRSIEHPRSISIQLLPSDEEEIKTNSPECEGNSPIINEVISESPRGRSDRFTLSQMGRLKIVELSFSDPENDSKSPDGVRSGSASSGVSVMSARRTTSGLQGQVTETTGLIPHPPSTPSSTYVARQKILLSKNKKTIREEPSALKLNKLSKKENKKWQPQTKYVGLDSFFMAGVEKENKKNLEKKTSETEVVKNIPDVNNCPIITVGFNDSWRPDSSWSKTSEPGGDDVLQSVNDNHNNGKITTNRLKNNSKLITKSTEKSIEKDRLSKPKNTPKDHMSISDNATPRVSLTDFDFLSAMPPMSKGDDFNKIHRASTATLFALSPQPPDIWNDDSEYELLNSPKVSKSPNSKSALNESDEDERALEALSNEITNDNKQLEGKISDFQQRVDQWEEDSLSIEDNDEGSGLTSSGDADTQYDGDDSSDNEYYNSKTQVESLN